MFFSLLILSIFIFLLYLYYKSLSLQPKKSNNFKSFVNAPGGIPGLGHLLKVGDRPHEYFKELSEKLGPAFKIQMGWKEFLILNNHDYIHKTLKLQGDNFSGRWDNIFSKEIAHYCGIFFMEKHWWAEQRSFTLKVLRDFGFGKFQTEDAVRNEGNKLFKIIMKSPNEYIKINDFLSVATVNVISDFIMKRQYEYDDTKILNLLKIIRITAQSADINNLIVNLYPIFERFPKLATKILAIFNPVKITQMINTIYEFVEVITNEHRQQFSPSNECNDLIDAFLLEQHKSKLSNQQETTFIDWQLTRLITELFFAGFETTSSTMSWTLLLISKFPQVQSKMFDEIKNVIGVDRLPTMRDKKDMPYTQAVMDEVYRVSSLVPLSVPHKVFNDASVNDYFIPANSIIITNLYACHYDETIWVKPFDFYPEHFLTSSGQYCTRPELMPFGIGKRQCLGESLARVVYFILLVMFVQKFTMDLSEDTKSKSINELIRGTNGVIRGPIDHKIKLTQRL